MLAPMFTLEESELYDGMTDSDVKRFRANNNENTDFTNINTAYHINKEVYDPNSEVKIRLISNQKLAVDFKSNKLLSST